MLYVTTKSKTDIFPALRTLNFDPLPDQGCYMPYRLAPLTEEELADITSKDFCYALAQILNYFFGVRLCDADVDSLIGARPLKMFPMSHRIIFAEIWRNHKWSFDYGVRALSGRILGMTEPVKKATQWAQIAVRVGVIFGIYSELRNLGILSSDELIDLAVDASGFSSPLSAFFAEKLGLPINMIVCGCGDNSALWDLFHQGEFRGHIGHPINADGVEQLIYERLGREEAMKFYRICQRGGVYRPDPQQIQILQKGFSAEVISQKRVEAVIPNVYRTNSLILSSDCAVAYGALQDYRALGGNTRIAVVLSEKCPVSDSDLIEKTLGISENKIKEVLQKI